MILMPNVAFSESCRRDLSNDDPVRDRHSSCRGVNRALKIGPGGGRLSCVTYGRCFGIGGRRAHTDCSTSSRMPLHPLRCPAAAVPAPVPCRRYDHHLGDEELKHQNYTYSGCLLGGLNWWLVTRRPGGHGPGGKGCRHIPRRSLLGILSVGEGENRGSTGRSLHRSGFKLCWHRHRRGKP